MIFITVGLSSFAFDRMLLSVDRVLSGLKVSDSVIFQVGESNYRPISGSSSRYFSFAIMQDYFRAADIIISHAGIGSILLALANNKKPVIYPRRKKFRENVDDHQLQIAYYWGSDEMVYNAPSEEDLENIIMNCIAGESCFSLPMLRRERENLITTVRGLL